MTYGDWILLAQTAVIAAGFTWGLIQWIHNANKTRQDRVIAELLPLSSKILENANSEEKDDLSKEVYKAGYAGLYLPITWSIMLICARPNEKNLDLRKKLFSIINNISNSSYQKFMKRSRFEKKNSNIGRDPYEALLNLFEEAEKITQ